MNLSALQQISGGVTVNAVNSGSVLDLSSLGPRWSGVGANGGLTVQAQSGSTILLPQLEELDQALLYARSGADIQAGKLRDIASVSVLADSSILRLTNVTSLVVSNHNPNWDARGAGGLLDLSHLTNLSVGDYLFVSVQANDGGKVDLSGLAQSAGALHLTANGAGSVVDMSGLILPARGFPPRHASMCQGRGSATFIFGARAVPVRSASPLRHALNDFTRLGSATRCERETARAPSILITLLRQPRA